MQGAHVNWVQRCVEPNHQGTRYLSIPDVNGIQIPTLPAQGPREQLTVKKLIGASSLGRRKIRYSLFGSTVLGFEFQSAACFVFRVS